MVQRLLLPVVAALVGLVVGGGGARAAGGRAGVAGGRYLCGLRWRRRRDAVQLLADGPVMEGL